MENSNRDLIMESGGHCFLCLNHSPYQLKQENAYSTASAKVCSLQSLSQYLNRDQSKRLNDNDIDKDSPLPTPYPNQTVDDIGTCQDRLSSITLCDECSSINKTFSELYTQLVKIEMEVRNCLELMHGKLVKGDEKGEFHENESSFAMPMEVGGTIQELERMKMLRAEIRRECSHKLSGLNHPWMSTPTVVLNSSHQSSIPIIESSNVKIECSSTNRPNEEGEEDDGNIYLDSLSHSHGLITLMEESNVEQQEDKFEEQANMNLNGMDPLTETEDTNEERYDPPPPPCNNSSLPPDQTPEFKRNLAGKFTCYICPSQFKTKKGCQYHFDSTHRGIRYQCLLCDREFATRHTHDSHHQVCHQGVSFQCETCKASFSSKDNLVSHQRKVKCETSNAQKSSKKKPFRCQTCGKGFARLVRLKVHFNTIHMKSEEQACHLCNKMFTRKDNLIRHHRRAHNAK